MSMSSRQRNTLVDKLNTSFAKLGTANGTVMPKSTSNLEPIAWNLWCAHHLATLANKRKERAEADAVKAGVIIDKEKDPQPAGTRTVLYNGDLVSVALEVRQPATRVSTDKVIEYLANHGVPGGLLDDAVAHATSTTRPAHVFSTMLITDEASGK
jgi:hypothetical protein